MKSIGNGIIVLIALLTGVAWMIALFGIILSWFSTAEWDVGFVLVFITVPMDGIGDFLTPIVGLGFATLSLLIYWGSIVLGSMTFMSYLIVYLGYKGGGSFEGAYMVNSGLMTPEEVRKAEFLADEIARKSGS